MNKNQKNSIAQHKISQMQKTACPARPGSAAAAELEQGLREIRSRSRRALLIVNDLQGSFEFTAAPTRGLIENGYYKVLTRSEYPTRSNDERRRIRIQHSDFACPFARTVNRLRVRRVFFSVGLVPISSEYIVR